MRRTLSIVLGLATLVAAGPALAHAFLVSAQPKAGARLAAAPSEVRITFSEPIEPAFSKITVAGPPGFAGAGPAKPAGDARTLATPLRAPLPPGTYRVRWRVISRDSHATQGAYSFELKP